MIPLQTTSLSASGEAPWNSTANGSTVSVATINVTAGTVMADRVAGTRFSAISHARKISSDANGSAMPIAVPAPPGLPAIKAAPPVAATTPVQEARVTRSPINYAETAISAGIAPTSRAARVTVTPASPLNWITKASP